MRLFLSSITLLLALSTVSGVFAKGDAPLQTTQGPTKAAKEQAHKLLEQARQKEHAEDYKGMMRDIAEVIKLDPTIPLAYCMRATYKQANHDYRGAVDDCTRAIELEPKNGYPGVYVRRAIPELNLKMFNECIRDCNMTLKRDPNNKMAFKYRAAAKVGLGQPEQAVSDINSYLKLAPNDEGAKQFRDQLMEQIQPTERDDEFVEKGYKDGENKQSVNIEHTFQTFTHQNHSFQLLPPFNTFSRSSLPMGGEAFEFTGPPDWLGASPSFHVLVVCPTASEPLPSEQEMFEAMLHPWRQRMTSFIEKEAQFQLANKTCKGVYFEGKQFWILGHKGFVFVTQSNGALFIFFGMDTEQHFDKSMRLFTETLKTCRIK